ncbi:MAG: hypothetical protein IPM74_02340 [Crocinitomicaceae bacterium]|nr:hypothetical protein [Crocinitomicaceae bacterium]MBK8924755.1 hypothetical protein [Crocinitomicaceae bacterium]
MIKKIFLLTTLLATLSLSHAQDDEIDSAPDKIKVEAAVVRWADSVFYKHSEYKFENFHAEYSDGYYIAVMRAKAYKERVTDLENDKASGRYKGTEDAYTKEHQSLTDAYQQAQTAADTYVERADYYVIHFWSNIQTTDGITVYYEHIVKLNNNYQVTEATINSAIGKKDENTKILYKNEVNGGEKKKDSSTPQEIKPVDNSSGTNTGSNTGNGSVGITTNTTDTSTTTTETSTKKEKKKKKK